MTTTIKAKYGLALVAEKKVHIVMPLRPLLPGGKIILPVE